MKPYVIITDTSCDLESSLRAPYGIECVPMHYIYDGKDFEADTDWKEISAPDFYNIMRGGTRIFTAQVNKESYKQAFLKHVKEGKDVLSISCSSEISASINASKVAREEVLKEYPDAKIVCVDALRACYALGILVLTAGELQKEGKSLDEVADWVEKNKLTVNMEGTVEKLTYLKQAGRVSVASAFFGGLLNIKPIIMADALGRNFAVAKVKGRMASFEKIAERVKDAYLDVPHQKMFISHADCLEDAELLKKMILEKIGKEIEVHIGYVGSAVGASVGPGMIGVYFFGKEVTQNKAE